MLIAKWIDGQYGEKLVADVKGDMLTKKGIALNNLKPVRDCIIYRDKLRNLSFVWQITEWRIRRRDDKFVLDYVRGSKDEGGDD